MQNPTCLINVIVFFGRFFYKIACLFNLRWQSTDNELIVRWSRDNDESNRLAVCPAISFRLTSINAPSFSRLWSSADLWPRRASLRCGWDDGCGDWDHTLREVTHILLVVSYCRWHQTFIVIARAMLIPLSAIPCCWIRRYTQSQLHGSLAPKLVDQIMSFLCSSSGPPSCSRISCSAAALLVIRCI